MKFKNILVVAIMIFTLLNIAELSFGDTQCGNGKIDAGEVCDTGKTGYCEGCQFECGSYKTKEICKSDCSGYCSGYADTGCAIQDSGVCDKECGSDDKCAGKKLGDTCDTDATCSACKCSALGKSCQELCNNAIGASCNWGSCPSSLIPQPLGDNSCQSAGIGNRCCCGTTTSTTTTTTTPISEKYCDELCKENGCLKSDCKNSCRTDEKDLGSGVAKSCPSFDPFGFLKNLYHCCCSECGDKVSCKSGKVEAKLEVEDTSSKTIKVLAQGDEIKVNVKIKNILSEKFGTKDVDVKNYDMKSVRICDETWLDLKGDTSLDVGFKCKNEGDDEIVNARSYRQCSPKFDLNYDKEREQTFTWSSDITKFFKCTDLPLHPNARYRQKIYYCYERYCESGTTGCKDSGMKEWCSKIPVEGIPNGNDWGEEYKPETYVKPENSIDCGVLCDTYFKIKQPDYRAGFASCYYDQKEVGVGDKTEFAVLVENRGAKEWNIESAAPTSGTEYKQSETSESKGFSSDSQANKIRIGVSAVKDENEYGTDPYRWEVPFIEGKDCSYQTTSEGKEEVIYPSKEVKGAIIWEQPGTYYLKANVYKEPNEKINEQACVIGPIKVGEAPQECKGEISGQYDSPSPISKDSGNYFKIKAINTEAVGSGKKFENVEFWTKLLYDPTCSKTSNAFGLREINSYEGPGTVKTLDAPIPAGGMDQIFSSAWEGEDNIGDKHWSKQDIANIWNWCEGVEEGCCFVQKFGFCADNCGKGESCEERSIATGQMSFSISSTESAETSGMQCVRVDESKWRCASNQKLYCYALITTTYATLAKEWRCGI